MRDEQCRIADVAFEYGVGSLAGYQRAFFREFGWKAFRIEGVLDFSVIGILADISAVLAKKKDFLRAAEALSDKGYLVK